MAESGPTPGVVLANTPQINNVSLPTAGVEVSLALPDKTRKIMVKCRGPATVKFAFIANHTNTTFITIPVGAVYEDDNLDLTGIILYLQANLNSQIIEVLSWSRT